MGSLPHFLTHGAARASRARAPPLDDFLWDSKVLVQFKTKRCIAAENKTLFLKEIVEYWFNLNYSEKNPVFESTCIWYNSLITIEMQPFFYKSWFKGAISWTAHVQAEAQNLKNSAEFFKIDPAKKRWRLQVADAAMAVNEGTRVAKKRFLTWNSAKESGLKTFNVLSSK